VRQRIFEATVTWIVALAAIALMFYVVVAVATP
jgi:hypothetical protein